MNNTTTASPGVYALPLSTWIVLQSLSILLTLIAFYVCVVLLHYSCVKNIVSFKRKHLNVSIASRVERDVGNNSSSIGAGAKGGSTSSTEGGKRKRSDGTGKAARPLRVLCLLAAFFALARISLDQLELGTYGGERVDCKTYQVLVVVTYAASATFNYSALWVRLRIFFNHPVMKHLASTVTQFLIWFSLAAIIGSAILNTLIFALTVSSVDSERGCMLGETTSISPTVRYVILTLSTVCTQGLLLSLFLYPLIKHRRAMKSRAPQPHPRVTAIANNEMKITKSFGKCDSDSDAGSSGSKIFNSFKNREQRSFKKTKKAQREKRLIVIMRRVLITAVVCVVSDVITAIVTIAFNNEARVVSNMAFNLNLLINIISVLLSFGDWQERLIPCCCATACHKKKKSSSNGGIVRPNKEGGNPRNRNLDHLRHYADSNVSAVWTPVSPLSGNEVKNDDVFTFNHDVTL